MCALVCARVCVCVCVCAHDHHSPMPMMLLVALSREVAVSVLWLWVCVADRLLLACNAVCVVLHSPAATVDAVDGVAVDAVAVGDTIAITPCEACLSQRLARSNSC